MATILQLGAGELMKHSIRQIQDMGHQVYAVDMNPNAPSFAIADGYAPIDLVDIDGISNYARKIGANAIIAVNEAGVLSAAYASQRLSLRGLDPDTALKALDKGMMREAWQKANLLQPNFVIVDSIEKISAAAEKVGYPLIIKPTMNWGSRGASAVFSPDDLQWSIDFAGQHQRSGNFIIEEYIDGIEMTIEGLIQNGKVQILAKSDKILQDHARFRVDLILHYPAQMSKNVLEKVDQLIIQAAQALELDNCAIHAEVMVRNQEVYLIEMAARPGGGHIFGQIVEAASGISMPQALTNILLGEDVDIRPKHQHGAIYRFFTPPEGIFIAIEGLEEAQQIRGVLDIGFEMASGTLVKPFTSGADRPGYCVTTGTTREEAIAIAEKAIATMRYTMESL